MTQTHTGEITRAAKKLSRWLVDKAKGAGAPTTEREMLLRAEAICKPLHFTKDDVEAVVRGALVFFKRDDAVGYTRVVVANMAGLSEIGSH